MAMISPLTTPADGRSLHAYGTRWRGLHAGRLGGLVAASAPGRHEHLSVPAAILNLERRHPVPAPRLAPCTARATGRCRPRVATRPAAAFTSLFTGRQRRLATPTAADLKEAAMPHASITVPVDAHDPVQLRVDGDG